MHYKPIAIKLMLKSEELQDKGYYLSVFRDQFGDYDFDFEICKLIENREFRMVLREPLESVKEKVNFLNEKGIHTYILDDDDILSKYRKFLNPQEYFLVKAEDAQYVIVDYLHLEIQRINSDLVADALVKNMLKDSLIKKVSFADYNQMKESKKKESSLLSRIMRWL